MDHLQKILISKTLDTIWTLNSWNKSNKTHQTNEQINKEQWKYDYNYVTVVAW